MHRSSSTQMLIFFCSLPEAATHKIYSKISSLLLIFLKDQWPPHTPAISSWATLWYFSHRSWLHSNLQYVHPPYDESTQKLGCVQCAEREWRWIQLLGLGSMFMLALQLKRKQPEYCSGGLPVEVCSLGYELSDSCIPPFIHEAANKECNCP